MSTDTRTFDTPSPIVAAIDVGAGHLTVRASDRTDTAVEVRPTDSAADADVQAARQARIEYGNGRLSVSTPKRKTWLSFLGRMASVDVVIGLPSDSRIEVDAWSGVRTEGRLGPSAVKTAAGSVHVDEAGRLDVATAAGDVSIGRADGHADVRTSSGKIRIGRVDGSAVVKTSNGDLTVGDITGDVRLTTANGDIAVDRAASDVRAKTAYGSIRIGEVARGDVVMETAFGDLEVGIREGTAAWLDVNSKTGSVRSYLDEASEPGPADETVTVHGRTAFGDVIVRRSPSTAPVDGSPL
jgi:Putative adhesin